MKRVVVLGGGGQLAADLVPVLRRAYEVVSLDRAALDVTDAARVRAALRELAPEVVVNCAAHTRVDACETEREAAFALNARAVEHLALALRPTGARLVQYSTDYVFDGLAARPYTEEDAPRPRSVYGASKLAGEEAARALGERALVVRTQWLYGPGARNFVHTIRTRGLRGEALRVVADQRGSPTCTWDVAEATAALLAKGCAGVYHAANAGETTWYGFAREILRLSGAEAAVEPCATDLSRYPAPRPAYGALSTEKLRRDTGYVMRPWKDALAWHLARAYPRE